MRVSQTICAKLLIFFFLPEVPIYHYPQTVFHWQRHQPALFYQSSEQFCQDIRLARPNNMLSEFTSGKQIDKRLTVCFLIYPSQGFQSFAEHQQSGSLVPSMIAEGFHYGFACPFGPAASATSSRFTFTDHLHLTIQTDEAHKLLVRRFLNTECNFSCHLSKCCEICDRRCNFPLETSQTSDSTVNGYWLMVNG